MREVGRRVQNTLLARGPNTYAKVSILILVDTRARRSDSPHGDIVATLREHVPLPQFDAEIESLSRTGGGEVQRLMRDVVNWLNPGREE